jgi:hypothetical protein
MAKYLLNNKDIIISTSFNDMRKQLIKKLKDDSYTRSFIIGVGV